MPDVELAGLPAVHAQDENAANGERPSAAAIAMLTCQHFSGAWNARTAEYAGVIYVVILFPDSLVPNALLGLLASGTVALCSGWAGRFVDKGQRLNVLRTFILTEKVRQTSMKSSLCCSFVNARQPHFLRMEVF